MSHTQEAAQSDPGNAADGRRRRGHRGRGEARDRSDRPRLNAAWKALLWTVVVALAVAPYPWW
jgi:hypothetical protein